MGMRTTIRGQEFCYRGLLGEVLRRVEEPDTPEGLCVVKRDGVELSLNFIDALFSRGLTIIEDGGRITASRCGEMAKLAQFASAAIDWLVNTDEEEIVFF